MKTSGLRYRSPRKFTWWQRIQLFIFPPVVAFLFKRLVRTCAFDVYHEERLWDCIDQQQGVILAFWHEYLGLAACQFEDFPTAHTLTSFSFDGEMAARTVSWFGLKSLRGSSSTGALGALRQLESAAKQGCYVGWTLDGPKGPRRCAKAGVAYLSARTNLAVLPNAYAISRAWRLPSWDRFPIPKPFSRIICAFGPVVPPPADTSSEAIEQTRAAVETALNQLQLEIEEELGEWRK